MTSYMRKFALLSAVAGILIGFHSPGSSADAASCALPARDLADLAARAKVPVPQFRARPGVRASYHLATRTIELPACATSSTIAHEFGHYVTDLASGGDWGVFTTLSARFTKGPNWLKTSKDLGGWERAAHCVGYVLGARGAYTRCAEKLLGDARMLVRLARTNAPVGS
jgi:hypothetical protein